MVYVAATAGFFSCSHTTDAAEPRVSFQGGDVMSYSSSFSSAYTGAAASLSSSYYLRNFYVSDRYAQTAAGRAGAEPDTLSLSDGIALRRAVRQLGSFTYDESQSENIRNSVLAYISTYNNALSSVSAQAADGDSGMKRLERQLKSLTDSYSGELDKMGITVDKDGTLKSRENLFKTTDLSKFASLFSKDSDYMQRISACAKRIQTHSETLIQTRRRQPAANNPADTGNTDGPAEGSSPDSKPQAPQIAAQSMDLNILCNTGIGANVNIIL